MKSKKLKKTTAICMAAVMVFSMTACGKKSDGSGNGQAEDTKNYVYSSQPIEFAGVQGDLSSPIVVGDKLYFSTFEWIEDENAAQGDEAEDEAAPEGSEENATDEAASEGSEENATDEAASEGSEEENTTDEAASEASEEENTTDEEISGTTVNRIYKCDLDGSNVEEIPFIELSDNEYFNNWAVDAQGDLVFLVSHYDQTTVTYSIVKTDTSGNKLLEQDITKDLGIDENNYVNKMLVDADGNYIVMLDSKIVVFDKDAKKVTEIKGNGWFEGMAVTKDGKIICGNTGEDGVQVQVVDAKSGSFSETYKLDLSYFPGSDSLISGGEYDFYYKDSSAIYGYTIAEKKGTKLVDFVASNMNGQNSSGIIFLPDGTFIATEYDSTTGKAVCSKYTKVDPSTIENKKTLVLAGTYIDEQVKEAVIAFNKSNDEYNISIKDYSSGEDPDTQFAADIVAGNIPDIISLNSLSVSQYVGKGVLADLTDYYTKDGLDKELLPSVAEAIKLDGKFYYVAPGFNLYTLAANSEVVHGKEGWTVSEMLDIIKEQSGKSQPFYDTSKSGILNNIIYASMSDYVDWSTGKCNFNSQEFKDIMTICNEIGKDEEFDYQAQESMPKMIQAGKVFLMDQYLDYEATVMVSKMFKDNVSFIGYPCKDGEGSFLQFNTQFGISAKSENKDGAWEFVKSLMTKEYQNKSWAGIPTRTDAYEMYKKARTTTVDYTDEFGNEVSPLQSGWSYDDFEVEIGPLSDEQVALFESVLNKTHKSLETDYKLSEIINEEAQAYFKGDKSVDEVCDIIQSRVSTYVNENR